jgi:hypothetical protein
MSALVFSQNNAGQEITTAKTGVSFPRSSPTKKKPLGRGEMKTSEAEQGGGKCPKCGGKTTQDLKNRGFVRHLEAFATDAKVPRGVDTTATQIGGVVAA